MLYQSLKLTNGIWILAELRIQPGNPNYTVRCQGAEGMAQPAASPHTPSSSSLLFLPACSLCFEGGAVNLAGGG